MKFTDGSWLLRPGVQAHFAAQAYSVSVDEGCLRVLAPTRVIRHRGDTLQGPLLTVRLSSPLPDVIRVRISHFEGVDDSAQGFPLNETEVQPSILLGEDEAAIESGRLRATVARMDAWALTFEADGRKLAACANRSLALMQVQGEGDYVCAQLSLGVGEVVYGLGERFTALVKNGQSIEIWNRDGGANTDQAYKNIPFYWTNRGYGVFVNDSGPVEFEVGTEKASKVQFSVPGQSLEFFILYGPTPREILSRYTALTGRPALPPQWSFGLWLSTSFTTDYDEATVSGFIDGMQERDIPLSVFHYDCFWMRPFHWCDLEWDPEVFPDPEGMLRRLKERGLKVSAWINPYVAQASGLFGEAKAGGYLLKRPNGDVWQWDHWQPGMAIVDFTNPKATSWFQAKLRRLIRQGVDALKTDFGERIPTDVAFFDGSDPIRMHNRYSLLYNRAVHEVLLEERQEGVLFARSATVGGQQFPVHWGGDCWSDFEAMAESLRGGLSLGSSGFGFWSHDIGGFEGRPPESLYKRWVAFGLLSSHSRLHGSGTYRVPWVYGDEAVEVLRFFTRLKLRLMPYLWGQAVSTSQHGTPLMRAMAMEFPDDPACTYLERQYMLGDSLLVAPVFSEDGTVEYYLPAGTWIQLLTGERFEGPSWRRETHSHLSLPLLLRPESLLVLGATDDRPDYDFSNGPIFVPGTLTGPAHREIHDVRGESIATVTFRPGPDDGTFEGLEGLKMPQLGRFQSGGPGISGIPIVPKRLK